MITTVVTARPEPNKLNSARRAQGWPRANSLSQSSELGSRLAKPFYARSLFWVGLLLVLGIATAEFTWHYQAAAPTVGRLTVLAGIVLAGVVSGMSGLAFPLIAGPIFLLTYPAPEAVALTAMCSLTGQLFSIALLRRVIDFQFRIPMIAAGLCGAPLGSALLLTFNSHWVRVVLGALIVACGLWRSLRVQTQGTRTPSMLSEVLVGLIGGLTGGLVGASSVVPAIWCAASGFDNLRQRAVTQPYILAMQVSSLVSLWIWGVLDPAILGQYADFVLPGVLGIGLGVAGFRSLTSSTATRVVMAIVAASGLSLLFL
jgi:uncharacterized protein